VKGRFLICQDKRVYRSNIFEPSSYAHVGQMKVFEKHFASGYLSFTLRKSSLYFSLLPPKEFTCSFPFHEVGLHSNFPACRGIEERVPLLPDQFSNSHVGQIDS